MDWTEKKQVILLALFMGWLVGYSSFWVFYVVPSQSSVSWQGEWKCLTHGSGGNDFFQISLETSDDFNDGGLHYDYYFCKFINEDVDEFPWVQCYNREYEGQDAKFVKDALSGECVSRVWVETKVGG